MCVVSGYAVVASKYYRSSILLDAQEGHRGSFVDRIVIHDLSSRGEEVGDGSASNHPTSKIYPHYM